MRRTFAQHRIPRTLAFNRLAPIGFTLIEMLVVVGMLALLLSIAVVGLNAARSAARDVATQQFLNSVSMAVSQYHRDFNDYPPSFRDELTNTTRDSFGLPPATFDNWNGAEILAQALVGPRSDDGAEPAAGFRQNSRNYGPYMEVNAGQNLVFVGNDDESAFAQYTIDNSGDYFEPAGGTLNRATPRFGLRLAAPDWPLLYYRANPRGTFASGSVWAANGRFDTDDNRDILTGMGFNETDPADAFADREPEDVASLETSLRGAQFILVAPGRDNLYGTENDLLITGP